MFKFLHLPRETLRKCRTLQGKRILFYVQHMLVQVCGYVSLAFHESSRCTVCTQPAGRIWKQDKSMLVYLCNIVFSISNFAHVYVLHMQCEKINKICHLLLLPVFIAMCCEFSVFTLSIPVVLSTLHTDHVQQQMSSFLSWFKHVYCPRQFMQ